MNNNVKIIINFIAAQMDNAPVPAASSAEFNQISDAIAAVQRASDKDLQVLALHVVGAVIDRIRSSIDAERAMHTFIRRGEL